MRRTIADLGKRTGGSLSAGLHAVLGSRAHGGAGILMFHRVCDEPARTVHPAWNVTPARMRDQLEGLLARGYQVWPLERALSEWPAGRIPPRTTVITFDDGYENVYLSAWPILKDLRLPATIFLATAFLDSTIPFPFDEWGSAWVGRVPPETWRPLRWEQCREMQASGLIAFGSHTHTHQDFRGRAQDLQMDLENSLAILREKLGGGPFPFAFPFGSRRLGFVSDAMVEAAGKTGVTCALNTEIALVSPRSSPFSWGRYEVVETDTGATIAAKLEGWYQWMSAARELFRSVSAPALGDPESER